MELYVHTGNAGIDALLAAALALWETSIPVLRTAGVVLVTADTVPAEEELPAADLMIVYCHRDSRTAEQTQKYGTGCVLTMALPPSLPALEKALTDLPQAAPPVPMAPDTRQTSPKLTLDSQEWTVRLNNDSVRLTEKEFALLSLLYAHRGQLVSRKELQETVWPAGAAGNVCEVHMTHLRRKLTSLLGEGILVSVRGKGYILH